MGIADFSCSKSDLTVLATTKGRQRTRLPCLMMERKRNRDTHARYIVLDMRTGKMVLTTPKYFVRCPRSDEQLSCSIVVALEIVRVG